MRLTRKIWKFAKQFLVEEDGPTAVEYAVMLAFIIAVSIGTVNTLATRLGENFDKSAEAIIASGQ